MKSDIIRGAAAACAGIGALAGGCSHGGKARWGCRWAAGALRRTGQVGRAPFAAIAGNWTGSGVIMLTNDIKENLRCRANHSFAQASSSLSLSIKCSSDNYRFELTSNVVERRGQISGKWTEASYTVSGNISGAWPAIACTAVAQGDKFTSPITLTTTGNRQTVSLTPETHLRHQRPDRA